MVSLLAEENFQELTAVSRGAQAEVCQNITALHDGARVRAIFVDVPCLAMAMDESTSPRASHMHSMVLSYQPDRVFFSGFADP